MKFSHIVLAVCLVAFSSAFPAFPKQTTETDPSTTSPSSEDIANFIDLGVLNYLLTLEHLEYSFYSQGLASLASTDFPSDEVYQNLLTIRDHEKEHVDALTAVIESLNGTAVSPCTYNFDFSSVEVFLATARALERAGVSAYAGIVYRFSDPNLVYTGLSISSVEGRHAAALNIINGYKPFYGAFDVPLGPRSVLTLVSSLIVSCPFNISASPYPVLYASTPVASSDPAITNLTIQVNCEQGLPASSGDGSGQSLYCAWLYSDQQIFTPVSGTDNACIIPSAWTGDLYVFVTSSTESLADEHVVCGPTVVTISS